MLGLHAVRVGLDLVSEECTMQETPLILCSLTSTPTIHRYF